MSTHAPSSWPVHLRLQLWDQTPAGLSKTSQVEKRVWNRWRRWRKRTRGKVGLSSSSPHLAPSTRALNTDHPSTSNMSNITETVPEPINSGGLPSAPPPPAVTPSEPSPTVETSVFLPGNVSVPMGQPFHRLAPSPRAIDLPRLSLLAYGRSEDLPDSAFDPTPSEVGAAYAAATGRIQANQVMRTSAMRAKDEGVKVPKSWPNVRPRFQRSLGYLGGG